MGSIDSDKAIAMLDAAEEILLEEGYAALTSRRVADYLGVKQRLVYYYFQTMDDLILETFKRSSRRDLDRLMAGISSDKPLHEVWNVCVNTTDARLISEYMALANRNDRLRDEVINFIEESRKIQIKALKTAMARNKNSKFSIPADAIAFMGTSIALALNREAGIGVKKGHAAVKKLIKQFFAEMEG